MQEHLQALGTEPFWSVDVLPGQLRYSDPENIAGIQFAATRADMGTHVRYSGTMQGKAVVLVIEPGRCSDGMSDTVYSFKASLTIAGNTEQGCARAK